MGGPRAGGGARAPGNTGGRVGESTSTPRGGQSTAAEESSYFVPGQDGNFAWNTTVPVRQKPILVYVFDGHVAAGNDFDYSKAVEKRMFKNDDVRELSREFICEKICVGDHEFLREVKGREAVHRYLKTMPELEKREVHVALLDSNGELIEVFVDKRKIRKGAPALEASMKKALKANRGV